MGRRLGPGTVVQLALFDSLGLDFRLMEGGREGGTMDHQDVTLVILPSHCGCQLLHNDLPLTDVIANVSERGHSAFFPLSHCAFHQRQKTRAIAAATLIVAITALKQPSLWHAQSSKSIPGTRTGRGTMSWLLANVSAASGQASIEVDNVSSDL